MEELKKFREFLNEEKFKVGDKVTMKSGGDEMEVTKARRMFDSKLNAYSVKKSDGEEVEYDESQLKLAESLFSVVKHFRNGSEPMFIQENLTLEQAKKIVNSFPDSQETMVTMLQQEKRR